MDQGSMEFRGTRHGVLLRAHIGPDVQRFVDALRQRLEKAKGFLSDSYVSARFEDDEVSVEAMHLIEAVLAESGLELRSVATGSRTVGLPTQAAVTQSGSSIAYTEKRGFGPDQAHPEIRTEGRFRRQRSCSWRRQSWRRGGRRRRHSCYG